MRRRWIIRAVFIGMLAMWVAAWVGSHWRRVYIEHLEKGDRGQTVLLDSGWLTISDHEQSLSVGGVWLFGHQPIDPRGMLRGIQRAKYHWAGFAYEPGRPWSPCFGAVVIPLWFPALLSALLLGFAWRKTRFSTARSFPVEPTNQAMESSGVKEG